MSSNSKKNKYYNSLFKYLQYPFTEDRTQMSFNQSIKCHLD